MTTAVEALVLAREGVKVSLAGDFIRFQLEEAGELPAAAQRNLQQ
jgi:hypothetical protein